MGERDYSERLRKELKAEDRVLLKLKELYGEKFFSIAEIRNKTLDIGSTRSVVDVISELCARGDLRTRIIKGKQHYQIIKK